MKEFEFELDCWKCEVYCEGGGAKFRVVKRDNCEICHGYGYVIHDGGTYRVPDKEELEKAIHRWKERKFP